MTAGGQRLTILHVADHVRNIGNGIANVVVDLACAQATAGHRVVLASGGGEYEPLLKNHGVEHVVLVRRDSPLGRVDVAARLLATARKLQPDVVNAHRAYATVAARLIRPVGHFALVATDHNEFEAKGRYLRFADLIIAVSEGAAAALRSTGVPRAQVRVVHNGPLNGARQSLTENMGRLSLGQPAVVTVAGLVERKGIHILLEAFEAVAGAHPGAHLYYVGDGPEKSALEAAGRRSRFGDRIHVEGFTSDPGRYLRSADIFVLASLREPFGLAALEARASGCAVIASDVDGLPEVLDYGEGGLLVAPGDAAALARALASLLGSAAELARWKQRSGVGLERFSAVRMADNTEQVYREALLARRQP